jgi:hypothetical protein
MNDRRLKPIVCPTIAVGQAIGLCGLSVLLIASLPLVAQSGAKAGEWRTYGGDLGNTHYSPADQINAANSISSRSLGVSKRTIWGHNSRRISRRLRSWSMAWFIPREGLGGR